MTISPDILRILLVLSQLGMVTLALLFLRTRVLSFTEFIGWGLLAFFVPFLGPFLVIVARPGEKHSNKA
jgi:hypothetical protein